MLVDVEHVHILGDGHHVDRGGLQHRGLRDVVDLFHDLLVGDDPAHAEARGEDLGEGAEVDDQALGVHALERGQILALEAQVAVGVVLDGGHAVLVDDLHELLAALQRPGAAGGVLEVGDDIDELDVRRGREDLVQLFHDHAVLIGGDGDEVGLILLEGVDRAEIARALEHDVVARVEEELAQEVQALLAAGGDEDVAGIGVDVVLGGDALANLLAQAQVAVGGAVLHGDAALLRHHGVQSGLHVLDREELGRGQTAGEGDDVGLGGDLKQLADVGSLDVCHSVGKVYHGGSSLIFIICKSCLNCRYFAITNISHSTALVNIAKMNKTRPIFSAVWQAGPFGRVFPPARRARPRPEARGT